MQAMNRLQTDRPSLREVEDTTELDEAKTKPFETGKFPTPSCSLFQIAAHGNLKKERINVLIDKMRLNPRNAAVVATALFLTGIVVLVFACASLRLSAEPAELARAFVVERKSEARFIRALIIWPSACFMGSAALLFLARQENLRGKRDQNISVEATDAGAS